MYLAQLDLNKKKLFLDLSIHAAMSNNNLGEEEKFIVNSYCNEMGLPKSEYLVTKDLDTVLHELKATCSPKEVNIILVEITALIVGDGVYDTLEKGFMKRIQATFEIADEKLENTILAINELTNVYKRLNEVIES
ncbi:hypothetical protein [Clostridium sulfidigenes]|uniref:hypothetical protein n=1 Tax=Clostridium sulfidigenes TaxID=318464 RepID=UPI003F897D03